jgi:hypothetical protein
MGPAANAAGGHSRFDEIRLTPKHNLADGFARRDPSDRMTDADITPTEIVQRCQTIMAHAWMVRTFVKHSDEAEDFTELMNLPRAVFDTARALETRVDDPAAYLKMLTKKIGKLRAAAEQFRKDAPNASAHTNFQQAVISMDACVDALSELLDVAKTSAADRPV